VTPNEAHAVRHGRMEVVTRDDYYLVFLRFKKTSFFMREKVEYILRRRLL